LKFIWAGLMNLSNYIKENDVRKNFLKFLRRVSKLTHIISIYLFGSIVRGDYNSDSDIDVLIITENSYQKEIRKAVFSRDYYQLDKQVINYYSGGLQLLILDINTLENSFATLPSKLLIEGKLVFGKPIHMIIEIEKLNLNNKPNPKLLFEELRKIKIPF